MMLERLTLRNIKCFEEFSVTFSQARSGQGGGWYVILGENGTGKSTLLQAIALALVGPQAAQRMLTHPEAWVREPHAYGQCESSFYLNKDEFPEGPARIKIEYAVTSGPVQIPGQQFVEGAGIAFRLQWLKRETRMALFHPVRALLVTQGSLQGDVEWPQRLRSEEQKAVINMVNSLLPSDAFQLVEVGPRGVFFAETNGRSVPLSLISSGYRALFGLAAHLLDWATSGRNPAEAFRHNGDGWELDCAGIVLLDQVDGALHPKWQREIGFRLQRLCPRVQFIVATHSPLLVQEATEGGIYVLRRGEGLGSVVADMPLETAQGWRVEQILSSPAFNMPATRDPRTEELISEHGDLVVKAHLDSLSNGEDERLRYLNAFLQEVLPPPGDTYEEMTRLAELMRSDGRRRD